MRRRLGEITNVEDLLAGFVESEKKAKLRHQAVRWVRGLFAGVLLPTSVSSIYFSSSFQAIHWATFGITALLGGWAFWSWFKSRGDDPVFVTSFR
jgi:hypothetical protein